MVPIHKKSKDQTNTDSYRSISLTSCVGELMERFINTRPVWYMEKNNIITLEQAGFWQHRSTEDQMTYIAQKIEDGFQDKTAYPDSVSTHREGVQQGLDRWAPPETPEKWCNRMYVPVDLVVHVDGTYSRKKTLREEAPLRGVLSPTLFLVFINDIVGEMPRKVLGACQNQPQVDHPYYLQLFKGTEGQPASQWSDAACRGPPHLPGGDFRQAAKWKQQTLESRSQGQGATCPHEVDRLNVGRRYCDSQETVHW